MSRFGRLFGKTRRAMTTSTVVRNVAVRTAPAARVEPVLAGPRDRVQDAVGPPAGARDPDGDLGNRDDADRNRDRDTGGHADREAGGSNRQVGTRAGTAKRGVNPSLASVVIRSSAGGSARDRAFSTTRGRPDRSTFWAIQTRGFATTVDRDPELRDAEPWARSIATWLLWADTQTLLKPLAAGYLVHRDKAGAPIVSPDAALRFLKEWGTKVDQNDVLKFAWHLMPWANGALLGRSRISLLQPGTVVDRVGDEYGPWLAPVSHPTDASEVGLPPVLGPGPLLPGLPLPPVEGSDKNPFKPWSVAGPATFAQRAIILSNTKYLRLSVLEPLYVLESWIAPWWGQVGGAPQYRLLGERNDPTTKPRNVLNEIKDKKLKVTTELIPPNYTPRKPP